MLETLEICESQDTQSFPAFSAAFWKSAAIICVIYTNNFPTESRQNVISERSYWFSVFVSEMSYHAAWLCS